MYAMGAEIILLDGFPRSADQTKWLRETLWQYPISVVRVMANSDFELARRAASRNRDEFDSGEKFQQRLAVQRGLLGEVEDLIRKYGFTYTTTINDYADRAALEIVSRIKLPKPRKFKE
jgi:adenylate kinase family enzyme